MTRRSTRWPGTPHRASDGVGSRVGVGGARHDGPVSEWGDRAGRGAAGAAEDARAAVLPPVPDPRRAAVRLAVVVALLALVVLATALSGPWRPTVTPFRGAETVLPEVPDVVSPTLPPEAREDVAALDRLPELPVELGWLWSLVAVALSIALGLAVLQVIRRHQLRDPASDPAHGDQEAGDAVLADGFLPDLDELRTGVAGAAEHLRSHARPADAVVAAWVALEEAAERSGVPRHPAATPTEFTVDVLDRTSADPRAVRTLLGLYLRARFGDEYLTADDVAAATTALGTLASTLGPRT